MKTQEKLSDRRMKEVCAIHQPPSHPHAILIHQQTKPALCLCSSLYAIHSRWDIAPSNQSLHIGGGGGVEKNI